MKIIFYIEKSGPALFSYTSLFYQAGFKEVNVIRAGELAQQFRDLVTLTEDLDLIPSTQAVGSYMCKTYGILLVLLICTCV